VLLRNFDVSKLADNQEGEAKGCFAVTKTASHTTTPGATRTLFVIEPYDAAAAERIYRTAVREELDAIRQRDAGVDVAKKTGEKTEALLKSMSRARADRKKKYPAMLKNARKLIDAKLYPAADKMLRRIVNEAPATDSAVQAKKELDSLPPH
jgi:hypothetical protein